MDEIPTQSLSGEGLPVASNPQSLNVSTMQHAIALQQFHFQQSLVSQQLTHAVSIKAAAEQAAARAAEISCRLLKGEKTDAKKEKAEEPSPKREKSKSQSQASSPSHSQSSKSKSISPIRYRQSRSERERYLPRENSSYRGRRYSSYYGRGRDDYRSNYRRNADRSRGRRYSYYRSRSPIRRRKRSPSRSWSPRYRRGEPPPLYHRDRSPFPKSNHRKSARGMDRRSLTRSPIGSSSLSPSPGPAKVRCPKRSTSRRSLSSSRSSLSRSTTSLLKKDNKGDLDGSSSENTNAPRRAKEATSSREKLRSNHSSSSSRSEGSSADHSCEKITGKPNQKKAVVGKRASAGGRAGSSTNLDGETVSRASETSDNGSEPMHIQDSRLSRRNEDDDRHGGLGHIKNEQKPSDSLGRRLKQDHPRSSEDTTGLRGRECNSDDENNNTNANDLVDKEELPSRSTTVNNRHGKELPQSSNEGLTYSMATETNSRVKVKDCRNQPEDTVTVEDLKNDQGDDVEATVMLPDGFTWDNNGYDSRSPTALQPMKKRSKQRSRSKERRSKHSRRRHKRRKKEESEEDLDSQKENSKERKLKKHRRKANRLHEKSQREWTRGKRKHRATNSSSSEDSSYSEGEHIDVAPSTGHKKKSGPRSP